MPSIPGSWIPTGAGSQLLYDLLDDLCTAVNPLSSGAAIQSALDNDRENGRRLELACGEITVTDTLDIDGGTGGGLHGQGAREAVAADNANARGGSVVIYNGTKAANEALFSQTRTNFIYRDSAYQGKSTADLLADTGTRTPIGLHVTRGPSYGSGKTRLYNTRWSGFGRAIVMGDAMADLNCDETRCYDAVSFRNGTFFQARNAQSLGHYFYGLTALETDTIFEFLGGGKLLVSGCDLLTEATFLHLDATDEDGWGQNFSKWTFRDINLDAQAINSRLLTCVPGLDYFGSKVRFDGVHLSMNDPGGWSNELINVGDNMRVRLNDVSHLCAGAIRWNTTTSKSSIHIRGCDVWSNVEEVVDLLDPSESTGSLRVIVENCYLDGTYNLLNSGTLFNEIRTGT